MNDVNWSVFSAEEKEAIEKLIAMGERDNISGGVLEMNQGKEVELQKIANFLRPVPAEFESDVMKRYTKERLESGLQASPQSPEEEAELQKLLDAEQTKFQEEHAVKNQQIVESVEPEEVKPAVKVEPVAVVPEAAIAEGMTEAEEKKICDTCETKGVRHLKSCPKFK